MAFQSLPLGISIYGCHISKVSKYYGCQATVLQRSHENSRVPLHRSSKFYGCQAPVAPVLTRALRGVNFSNPYKCVSNLREVLNLMFLTQFFLKNQGVHHEIAPLTEAMDLKSVLLCKRIATLLPTRHLRIIHKLSNELQHNPLSKGHQICQKSKFK